MAQPIIQPGGRLKLYANVPIGYGEQVIFSSKAEQARVLAKFQVFTVENCSYISQRVRFSIPSPAHFKNLEKVNYMSYINTGFSDREFFGAVQNLRMINNITAEFEFIYDALQTYMCEFSALPCRIVREQLSANDWATATATPNAPINELLTREHGDIPESLKKKLSYSEDAGAFTPVGTFTYLPYSRGSAATENLMKPVALFKLNWYISSADATPVNFKTGDGSKSITVKAGEKQSERTMAVLNLLNQFDGFITPGHDFIKPKYTDEVQKSFLAAKTAWAFLGVDANVMEVEVNNQIVPLRWITEEDPEIRAGGIQTISDWFAPESFQTDTPKPTAYDNRIMNEILAWFELDEQGNLPVSASNTLNAIAVAGLFSNISYCARVPKIFTQFVQRGNGFYNRSWPNNPEGVPNTQWLTRVNPTTGPLHPKVYRAPYDYLHVTLPDGSGRDFAFDEFMEEFADFALYFDVHSTPTMYVIPRKYKMERPEDAASGGLLNTYDALSFNKFPQLPISADGFLVEQSGNFQQAANPSGWEKFQSIFGNLFSGGAQGAGQGASAGGVGAAIGGAIGAVGGLANAAPQIIQRETAKDILHGDINKAYDGFWFPSANYSLGSVVREGQTFALSQAFNDACVTVEHHGLLDEVRQSLSDYFNEYGCASTRVGVPRVLNYMKKTGDVPHFTKKDETTRVGTAVKTEDIIIQGVNNETKDEIARYFTQGTWFWKGESL